MSANKLLNRRPTWSRNGVRTMPDSVSRAKLFRERAEECRRLARIAGRHEIGRHYPQIAEHCSALAEAEEKLAGKLPPPLIR